MPSITASANSSIDEKVANMHVWHARTSMQGFRRMPKIELCEFTINEAYQRRFKYKAEEGG